jgi:hypothetical protein
MLAFKASLLVSDLAKVRVGVGKTVSAKFGEKQATFTWVENKITNCVHLGLGFTHYVFFTPEDVEEIVVDNFQEHIPPKHVCENAVVNFTREPDGVSYHCLSFSPEKRARCHLTCLFCGGGFK